MQIVDFKSNQFFYDVDKNLWKLIDITEVRSLLNEKRKRQIIVHLYSPETKKIKRLDYVEFESNFVKIESGLLKEVELLNRLFTLESEQFYQ